MEERVAQLRSSGSVLGDNRTGLEAEFERLSHVTHSPAKFSAAMLPENMAKNRLANIKPCKFLLFCIKHNWKLFIEISKQKLI